MKNILILAFLLFTSNIIFSQKTITLEDAILSYQKGLQPTRLANLQWAGSSAVYSYLSGDKLILVDRSSQKETILNANVLGGDKSAFPYISWLDKNSFYYKDGETYYTYNLDEKKLGKMVSFQQGAENRDFQPESNSVAYTMDNDLYVSTPKGENVVVVNNDDSNIVSGQAIARYEFGISKGTFWSPKGKYLAFYEKDESSVWDYPLLDISKTPGALNSVKYPMAGQKSEIGRVGIYNVKKGKVKYIENSGKDDHYYTNLSWGPKGKYIYIAEINRDQNHMWLNKYKASNGKFVETLLEETSDAWVEPETPANFISKKHFLWFSEKDGFMNLYRYDANGKGEKQLTKGQSVMQSIVGFDSNKKYAFVQGTGKDARERHIFKVNLHSGEMTQVTKGHGVHSGSLSPDGKYILDSYTDLNTPFRVDIIKTKNKKTKTIYTAENPFNGFTMPSVEMVDVPTKFGDLHARIIKPSNFNASKKYPVLVYVYGGPHAQMVTDRWNAGAPLWMNWMAEQGYIIFTLDNRGSENLGFEKESQIHRQLGKIEIEDQMTGVKYLKSLPYVDGDRLAVHGWSFGGFMTTSMMLKKAGTFNVGVAGGPVIDWKWYEIMYGERYMDRPEENPEGYKNANLTNYVENLKGKLLTIHGGMDDVVVMQHNLAFHRACIEKGIYPDFYMYPTHKHNVRGKDRVHLMTKVLNYIMENNK